MNIVVAGGAGFLGSHLCERLLGEGHEVTCVDNLLTGSEANIEKFKANSKFHFLKHDVTFDLPTGLKANRVYHLASPASPHLHNPRSYHVLAFETMQVNTVGTWKLCEFAVANNARLLFASTSETYGDPLVHPQTEEYRGNVSTIGPRSVYDEAKRFGETIVAAFTRKKGLDGRIMRIFNTYGPGMAMDDGRVVYNFVQAALKNEAIPIFGAGTQTRSFCYVDDLISGMVSFMEHKSAKGEVINLGNPTEFTILELAEVVKKVTQSSSEIVFKETLPIDDPLKRRPDISKAKKILGWEPKISLEEGLLPTIDYIKSLI